MFLFLNVLTMHVALQAMLVLGTSRRFLFFIVLDLGGGYRVQPSRPQQ